MTLKLYPSGFQGSSSVKQTQLPNVSDLAFSAVNRTGSKFPTQTGSVAADEIGQRLLTLSSPPDLEMAETIITQAYLHFDNLSLEHWVSSQRESPNFTDTHQRWVIETLAYIDGKPRTFYYHTWINLLSSENTVSTNAPLNRTWAYQSTHRQGHRPSHLEEMLRSHASPLSNILANWTRQPGGIIDLGLSLYVLFGSRDQT